MEIPKTLEYTWNKLSKDGKISQNDFKILVNDAAPNRLDAELDADEEKFLNKLKTTLEKSPEYKTTTGGVPVNEVIFNFDNDGVAPKEEVTEKSEEETALTVPDTLQTAWNNVTTDGKLTTAGFDQLVRAAAPHKQNKEFDDEEVNFLANLRLLLEKNNGVLSVR